MNKLFTKIAGLTLGLAMAVGVGVAGRLNGFDSNRQSHILALAANGDEHKLNSFTGKGTGTVLNKGATPSDITITNPGYPIKSIKIGWSHNKTGTSRVTATVTVGGEEFGTGQVAFSATPNPLVITASDAMTGNVEITWSNNYTKNSGGGTLSIDDIWLVEGEASTKTSTSITLSANPNKNSLDLNEQIQLSAVVKDDEDNAIGGATVSYTSSDETVATVSSSGLITASSSKYGKAVITARYEGDENYKSCTAKFNVTVSNPLLSTFVIADIASENGWNNGDPYDSLGTIGNVTITGSGTTNNKKYYSSDDSWRFYSTGDGKITVTANGYYYIKTITFTASDLYFTSVPAGGNWSYSDSVFTSLKKKKKTVTLSNGSGTSKINEIEVKVAFDWCTYFIDTFTCTGAVAGHENGDISVANPTTVWSDLAAKFVKSDESLISSLKVLPANINGNIEEKAMARYDLVIRKYGKATYTDFIGRFSDGGVNASAMLFGSIDSSNVSSIYMIIVLISVLSVASIGGYFFLRKRKENN